MGSETDNLIRYLHGRCLRLESCRKALVWQKRYLQRVLAGYHAVERDLAPVRGTGGTGDPRGRFKCAAVAVTAVLRMQFLVRRRLAVRALSAAALLPAHAAHPAHPAHVAPGHRSPTDKYTGTSPPSRDRPTPAAPAAPSTPTVAREAAGRESLARRVLKQEMRLNLPASPGAGDFTRRSPYNVSSPREEPFILSSPRTETAAAYLNKLELVSRCLSRALDVPRDAP